MTLRFSLALLIPLGYLLGSIPFGLLVGWSKGVDPRKSGSGNIGATNVGRLLGRPYFWLVFILDLLKGALPMLAGVWLFHHFGGGDAIDNLLWLCVAAACICGHMFSLFLGFKGGKGVATGAGVALGLYPYMTVSGIIGLAVFLIVFKITRTVSLGSIIASSTLPITYLLIGLWRGWDVFGTQLPILIFISALAGLIIFRHRSNIARLRAGTESKFERKTAA